jgi:hypothetical protein
VAGEGVATATGSEVLLAGVADGSRRRQTGLESSQVVDRIAEVPRRGATHLPFELGELENKLAFVRVAGLYSMEIRVVDLLELLGRFSGLQGELSASEAVFEGVPAGAPLSLGRDRTVGIGSIGARCGALFCGAHILSSAVMVRGAGPRMRVGLPDWL